MPSFLIVFSKAECLLFGLPLFCNFCLSFCDLFGITKIVVLNGLQIIIQLIYERNSGWDIQPHYFFITNLVNIFYKGPYAVPMCRDKDPFPLPYPWKYHIFPIRDKPGNSISQTFSSRNFILFNIRIFRIYPGISFVISTKRGRPGCVTSSPYVYLILPYSSCHFLFIMSLKVSVMPFVETPGFIYRYPHKIHLIQYYP